MTFFIKDFFSKCDRIRSFLRIWSHLLKKSLMENFIFCAEWDTFFMQFSPDMCLVSVNELNMCLVNAELFLYFTQFLEYRMIISCCFCMLNTKRGNMSFVKLVFDFVTDFILDTKVRKCPKSVYCRQKQPKISSISFQYYSNYFNSNPCPWKILGKSKKWWMGNFNDNNKNFRSRAGEFLIDCVIIIKNICAFHGHILRYPKK